MAAVPGKCRCVTALKSPSAPRARKPAPKPKSLPDEWWELVELTFAGCPDEAFRAFRKPLIIGKTKVMPASFANAAVSGVHGVLRTGPLVGREKRAEEPERPEERLARLYWYWRQKMPVVLAVRRGSVLSDEELNLACEVENSGGRLTVLIFDDTNVERADNIEAVSESAKEAA